MSNPIVQTDVFFAEFDGRSYAYGLTSDETRATVESSFRFGEPSDDGALGNSWANPIHGRHRHVVPNGTEGLRH